MSAPLSHSDKNPAATNSAVIDAVYKRLGFKDAVGDSRRNPRKAWQTQLDVVIGYQASDTDPGETVRVTTIDLSRNGFAFLYRNMVHPGTRVRVCFGMLSDRPTVVGTVRHCRHVGGTRHHVGVQFD